MLVFDSVVVVLGFVVVGKVVLDVGSGVIVVVGSGAFVGLVVVVVDLGVVRVVGSMVVVVGSGVVVGGGSGFDVVVVVRVLVVGSGVDVVGSGAVVVGSGVAVDGIVVVGSMELIVDSVVAVLSVTGPSVVVPMHPLCNDEIGNIYALNKLPSRFFLDMCYRIHSTNALSKIFFLKL